MSKQGYSPAMIRTDLSAIRFFCNLAGNTNQMPDNSKLNLEKRTVGAIDRAWTEREIALAIIVASEMGREDVVTFLKMGRVFGMRIEEACVSEMSHQKDSLFTRELYIRGKNGQVRYLKMKIGVYYDIENLGGNCDITFIYEQLLVELGIENTYEHYAYYDWEQKADLCEIYNSLMINCISIRELSVHDKVKNLADIKMSVDIAIKLQEQNEDAIVIVSGDAHFLTIVNSLRSKAIEVYIAAYKGQCSKDLRQCSDKYLPINPIRPSGQNRGIYSTILRLYNNRIDHRNAYTLFNTVLETIATYAMRKFEKDGIILSELQSLTRNYRDINVQAFGYKNATNFFRALTSETDYCVARCENESSSIKIFKRGFVKEGYIELPSLQKVEVNSKAHYCNIAKIPQDFNTKTMKRILNKIRVDIDDLPEMLDYLIVMKNIGVIKEENKQLRITRSNYFNKVIKDYIRKKVQEEGIPVDEDILNEFI